MNVLSMLTKDTCSSAASYISQWYEIEQQDDTVPLSCALTSFVT